VLFDEVEKAHHDVFNVLLQILDDGRLTDGHGRTVDFRNAVLIMTPNIGSQEIQRLASRAGADLQQIRDAAMEHLRAEFRPEFLNRVDEIVVFRPLGATKLAGSWRIQLGRLRKLLAERPDHRVAHRRGARGDRRRRVRPGLAARVPSSAPCSGWCRTARAAAPARGVQAGDHVVVGRGARRSDHVREGSAAGGVRGDPLARSGAGRACRSADEGSNGPPGRPVADPKKAESAAWRVSAWADIACAVEDSSSDDEALRCVTCPPTPWPC